MFEKVELYASAYTCWKGIGAVADLLLLRLPPHMK